MPRRGGRPWRRRMLLRGRSRVCPACGIPRGEPESVASSLPAAARYGDAGRCDGGQVGVAGIVVAGQAVDALLEPVGLALEQDPRHTMTSILLEPCERSWARYMCHADARRRMASWRIAGSWSNGSRMNSP